jgi:hypothetical protein
MSILLVGSIIFFALLPLVHHVISYRNALFRFYANASPQCTGIVSFVNNESYHQDLDGRFGQFWSVDCSKSWSQTRVA